MSYLPLGSSDFMADNRKDFMCKYLAQLELPCKFDQKEAYSNEICTKCYQKNKFCIPPTNRVQDRKEKVTKWIDYEKNSDGICLECPKEQYECHDCQMEWFGTASECHLYTNDCEDATEKPHELARCKNDQGCDSLKKIPSSSQIPKFGVQCVSGTKALCSSCTKEHQLACLRGGGLKKDQCKKHWI